MTQVIVRKSVAADELNRKVVPRYMAEICVDVNIKPPTWISQKILERRGKR